MIQIQNVSKSFGEQVLLDGASMLVGDHERVGLVGRNGCGKSTLFKMILGQECIDGGSIDIPKKYTLGYLQQHLNFNRPTTWTSCRCAGSADSCAAGRAKCS